MAVLLCGVCILVTSGYVQNMKNAWSRGKRIRSTSSSMFSSNEISTEAVVARSYRLFDPKDLNTLLCPLSEDEANSKNRVNEILRKSVEEEETVSVIHAQVDNNGMDTQSGTDGEDSGKKTGSGVSFQDMQTFINSKVPSSLTVAEKADEEVTVERAAPAPTTPKTLAPKKVSVSNIVWAEEIQNVETGCVLLNNWKQIAVVVTDYDPAIGAKGYEVDSEAAVRGVLGEDDLIKEYILWPPLALELEIIDRHWQPVRVSDNVRTAEIFSLLPPKLQGSKTSVWEFIFALLLHPQDDRDIAQTLLDTGLSPKQGLFAFMRLSKRISDRVGVIEAVPDYQKISDQVITYE